MKDLKDYFNTSPTKSVVSKTPPNSNKSAKNSNTNESQDQSSKKNNKQLKKPKKNGNKHDISIENNERKRKSLSQSPIENVQNTKNCKPSKGRREETETLNKTPEVELSPKTPTVNAFQFLMNSRNKVIGTNSPGKELLDKEKSPSDINKETLKARKQLLQGWSDTKKASKRKLEDEEIDKCIKVKLNARKKRFKTLLNVDSTDDENSQDANLKELKINLNSSEDFEPQDEDVKRSRKKKQKKKENLTPSKSWKMKIKLVNEDQTEEIPNEEPEVDENCIGSKKVEEKVKPGKQADKKVIVIEDSPNTETNRRVLRNRTSLQKPKHYVDYSDEDSGEDKQKKLKVAPVFTKSVPKPKEHPDVIEARRKFLMSEIPDVLKKRIEKQESITVPDFDVFPKISHIRQENQDIFWNLPDATLEITGIVDYELNKENCEKLIDRSIVENSQYSPLKPLKNIKTIVRNLKLENPAYPVYRTYRILKEKQAKSEENTTWTEKYKPMSSQELLENSQAISTLKNWLESWNEMLSSSRKRCKISSDSESDFQSSDAESCYGSLKTGMVLIGPCGSGKSSTVYALCNELGFEVIELNASSRRTGKQVLQELQEATQSHQVRKNKELFQVNPKKTKKMCVLLIEDIDLVFEQDEGFIVAISQISTTTKRPIILTTTDKTSPHTQKFTNDFKTVKFKRISTPTLSIWAQVMCLLEGIFVENQAISELFQRNNGDVRKTLLELQLWVESGGQINDKKNSINSICHVKTPIDVVEVEDDEISLRDFAGKLENYKIHTNVVLDFEIMEKTVDLRKIWWNFPVFLNAKTSKTKRRNREKLQIISKTYDIFTLCDLTNRKILNELDVKICEKRWDFTLQDSLKIEEPHVEFSANHELFQDLNHFILDKSLENCTERFVSPRNQRVINMGLPDFEQQSEIAKNHRYEEELMQAVPLSSHLDRKSVSLDYLSTIRNIARIEKKRAETNSKRNNRFYNYLQNFNVNCSNNALIEFASNTFRTN